MPFSGAVRAAAALGGLYLVVAGSFALTVVDLVTLAHPDPGFFKSVDHDARALPSEGDQAAPTA